MSSSHTHFYHLFAVVLSYTATCEIRVQCENRSKVYIVISLLLFWLFQSLRAQNCKCLQRYQLTQTESSCIKIWDEPARIVGNSPIFCSDCRAILRTFSIIANSQRNQINQIQFHAGISNFFHQFIQHLLDINQSAFF